VSLLCKNELGFLVGTLLSGIPLQAQRLLSKSSSSVEDFLTLTLVDRTGRRTGIQANFATSPTGCDAYVGCSVHLKRRIATHLKITQDYTVNTLPEEHAMSVHCRAICPQNGD
jgi:hypothetical protein